MAPLRELPEHSVGLVTQPDDRIDSRQDVSSEKTAEKLPAGKPLFKEPDFGSDGSSDTKVDDLPPREEVLSPTQTRA
jgi:hypothetical protein